ARRHRDRAHTQALVFRSLAAQLRPGAAPETAADLNRYYAIYRPTSGKRLEPGTLIYYLAQPIAALRDRGRPEDILRAEIMELRLIWMAGLPDRALTRAEALLTTTAYNDRTLNALLADAAVLFVRAGRVDDAERLMQRALACGTAFCPDDIFYSWIDRDAGATSPAEAADPEARYAAAKSWVATHLGRATPIEAAMAQEHAFATGQLVRELGIALDLALQPSDTLSDLDRARIRGAADRYLGSNTALDNLFFVDTVSNKLFDQVYENKEMRQSDLLWTQYTVANEDGTLGRVQRKMALLAVLYAASDRSDDWLTANLARARMFAAMGARTEAIEVLTATVSDARAQGYTDRQIAPQIADLWAFARRAGRTDLEDEAWSALQSCRERTCSDAVTRIKLFRVRAVPIADGSWETLDLDLRALDAVVRAQFGDDPRRLADVYRVGIDQDRPMDSARFAEISMGFAARATDISDTDMQDRAREVINILVYAGKYDEAVALGDRILAEVPKADLSGDFFQVFARAAHRLDDPRAKQFYIDATAREVRSSSSLLRDLLDTPFSDVAWAYSELDRQMDIKARFYARDGQYVNAAQAMGGWRLRYEYTNARKVVEAYTHQASIHRATNLDAYVAAKLRAEAANRLVGIENNPFIYRDPPSYLLIAIEQEAYYWEQAGGPDRAAEVRALVTWPDGFGADWAPLQDRAPAEAVARLNDAGAETSSYDLIRSTIDARDDGNYQGAAQAMRRFRWLAMAAEANGSYTDAQTLWQMAYTFARVGETDIAFDLMNRAARIAANLSFEGAGGAGGGTLQLLERDRWRYLLFVDIAWAAASGQAPDQMTVVSRY
ncbi:MAG: hypothetical protein AAGP08_14890, partial [Pseudomonadota bacterium]